MPNQRYLTGILLGAPVAVVLVLVIVLGNITGFFRTSGLLGQVGGGTCINGYAVTEYNGMTSNPAGGNGKLRSIVTGSDNNLWYSELDAFKIAKMTTAGAISGEYTVPGATWYLGDVTKGPDGNIWAIVFSTVSLTKIAKITPGGTITQYPFGGTGRYVIYAIAAGPDGNVWYSGYTDTSVPIVGKITPSGVMTEYTIPGTFPQVHGLVAGPDGNMWVSAPGVNNIDKVTPAGVITEYPIPTASSNPDKITVGPDGNMWFTTQVGNVDRITPQGVITEFSAGSVTQLGDIVAGPDGNLWFTVFNQSTLGRMTTQGTVSFYTLPGSAQGWGITKGPDNNIWFTDVYNKIGKIVPCNTAPVANDDTATTPMNTPVDVPVIANDTDQDGDTLGPVNISTPSQGSVIENPDRTIRYTPPIDFFGSVSFTYTVSDGNGGTDTGTVTITVTGAAASSSSSTCPAGGITAQPYSMLSQPQHYGMIGYQAIVGPDDNFWFMWDTLLGVMSPQGAAVHQWRMSHWVNGEFPMTIGGDGNVWYADGTPTVNEIVRVTTNGDFSHYPVPRQSCWDPFITSVTTGADGNVWYAKRWIANGCTSAQGQPQNWIGKVAPDGTITEYPAPYLVSQNGMTAGPDGNVWFGSEDLATSKRYVSKIDPDGVVTSYFVLSSSLGAPTNMISGPGDEIWFTIGTLVYRMKMDGTLDGVPSNNNVYVNGPNGIYTMVSDGTNVWLMGTLQQRGGVLGKITPTGTITYFDLPPSIGPSSDRRLVMQGGQLWVNGDGAGNTMDQLIFCNGNGPAAGGTCPAGQRCDSGNGAVPFCGNNASQVTYTGQTCGTNGRCWMCPGASNRAPVAVANSVSTPFATPVSVNVLANDSDPDGDPLTVINVGTPSNGFVTNQNGNLTYTPHPGFSGTNTFSYTISDGHDNTATTTVTVTVAAGSETCTVDYDNMSEHAMPAGFTIDYTNLVHGQDGNLWFADLDTKQIGKMTPSGQVTLYPVSQGYTPRFMVAGPGGKIWFTEVNDQFSGKLASISTNGTIGDEYDLDVDTDSLAAGPDGNLWYTSADRGESVIYRTSPQGETVSYPTPKVPRSLQPGSDGNVWFMEMQSTLAKITTDGTVTEYSLPGSRDNLQVGADGNMWALTGQGKVTKVTPNGTFTTYTVQGVDPPEQSMGVGPDGNIWVSTWGVENSLISITRNGASETYDAFPDSDPETLAGGPGMNVWYLESQKNMIGQLPIVCGVSSSSSSLPPVSYCCNTITHTCPVIGEVPPSCAGGQHYATSALCLAVCGASSSSAKSSVSSQSSAASSASSTQAVCPACAQACAGQFAQASSSSAPGFFSHLWASLFSGPSQSLTGQVIPAAPIATAQDTSGGGFFSRLWSWLFGGNSGSMLAQLGGNGTAQCTNGQVTCTTGVPVCLMSGGQPQCNGSGQPSCGAFGALSCVPAVPTCAGTGQPAVCPSPLAAACPTGYNVNSGAGCSGTKAICGGTSGQTYNAFCVTPGITLQSPGQSCSVTVTEYTTPANNSRPFDITPGLDGNVWFTESQGIAPGGMAAQIARVTPSGTITEYPILIGNTVAIAAGPDGNMWYTTNANKVGKMTPGGQATEYDATLIPQPILSIAAGSDGNMWYLETQSNNVDRITPAGVVTRFNFAPGLPVNQMSIARSIVKGPDGNMWFIRGDSGNISKITPAGVITQYPLPGVNGVFDITAGPDGNMWFSSYGFVGKITTSGVITAFNSDVSLTSIGGEISAGADGNVWVLNKIVDPDMIYRITPAGVFTGYSIPKLLMNAGAMTLGPDGSLWAAEDFSDKVAKIVPSACAASSLSSSSPASSIASSASSASSAGTSVSSSATLTCDQCLAQLCGGSICAPLCGDGLKVGSEQCDDGNINNGDGCSNQCLIECDNPNQCNGGQCLNGHCTGICGNGTLESPEQCDDGNVKSGDGCSAQCVVECSANNQCQSNQCVNGKCNPICGNTVLETPEQCDDGNVKNGDGCSAQCVVECTANNQCQSNLCINGTCNPICGNKILETPEQCDDGNVKNGDGCTAQCVVECSNNNQCGGGQCTAGTCTPVCGNGVIEKPEECDDHNTADGDNCSHLCKIEEAHCPTDACASLGGTEFCASQGRTCTSTADLPCISCSGQYDCMGDECGKGGQAYCTQISPVMMCSPISTGICIDCKSSSSSSTPVCPPDACGAGGKQFCEIQGRTCLNDGTSSTCIKCDGQYDCKGDECDRGGKSYCTSLGNKGCRPTPDGICIDCKNLCSGDECGKGGDKFCSTYGKQCVSDTASDTCINCAPEPAFACTNTTYECSHGGSDYCATLGEICTPSADGICIKCVEPGTCTGGECGRGGSDYCATLANESCSEIQSGICIACGDASQQNQTLDCRGNECRKGGAKYCAGLGEGCRNTSDGLCVTCTPDTTCRSDLECSDGSRCSNGACVVLCGNGRLDAGEACDGGDGCTADCLLAQNQQCTHDTECQSTLCLKNTCVPCTTGTQCQSNDCREGSCVNLCGNGKTDPGEICDPGLAGDAPGCTRDCLRAIGAACQKSQDCQTGLCGNAASGNGSCIPCTGDNQCGSNICASGTCVDLCGNGKLDAGEKCDDGNRITGDGCDRFCDREAKVAGEILPVSLLGDVTQGGDVLGENIAGGSEEARRIAAGHAAAGKTGPAAVVAIAGGAAAGWSWVRKRKRQSTEP